MATNMIFLVNDTNSDHDYENYPADFGELDFVNDYLIWTAGDATVTDLMTSEPTQDELNAAASIIDDVEDVMIALCLWLDYSHNRGGSYYTHKVLGMGENKRYSFCFSFDGATATKPRLEAWDDDTHTTADSISLGSGVGADSFIKAVKTTDALPGAEWAGTPIAGAANYVELDNAALVGAKDLYCNCKVVLPGGFATPSADTPVLTCRYTYL